jgi:hypothetical protein
MKFIKCLLNFEAVRAGYNKPEPYFVTAVAGYEPI